MTLIQSGFPGSGGGAKPAPTRDGGAPDSSTRQRRRRERRRLVREQILVVLVLAAALGATLVLLGLQWLRSGSNASSAPGGAIVVSLPSEVYP